MIVWTHPGSENSGVRGPALRKRHEDHLPGFDSSPADITFRGHVLTDLPQLPRRMLRLLPTPPQTR